MSKMKDSPPPFDPPMDTTPQIVAAELDKHTVRALISRWVTFGYSGAQLFRQLLREYALLAASSAREILRLQDIVEQQGQEIARLSKLVLQAQHALDVSEAEHALDILLMERVYARVLHIRGRLEILATGPLPTPSPSPTPK